MTGLFKRSGIGTQAPGAATTAPQQATHPQGPIGFQTPAVQAIAPQSTPVVASAATPQPEVQVVQPAAQQPVVQASPQAPPTALVPVQQPVPPAQLALSAELMGALSAAGFDPLSPCALLDMGGVHEALGTTLPILRIEYAQSNKAIQEGLKRGLLTNMATKEQVGSMRLVLLAVKLQRIMWPEVYDAAHPAEQPLCMSQDGKSATRGEWCEGNLEGLFVGAKCDNCSFAQWRNVSGQRKPPLCSLVYTQLMVDRDAQAPVVFPAKKTAIKTFKAAYSQVTLKAMRYGDGLPPAAKQCAVGFTLKPMPVKNYYVPEYGAWEQIPLEEATGYAQMLAGMIQHFTEVDISKEGADADGETEEAGTGYASGGNGNGYTSGGDTSFNPGEYEQAPPVSGPRSGPRKF